MKFKSLSVLLVILMFSMVLSGISASASEEETPYLELSSYEWK